MFPEAIYLFEKYRDKTGSRVFLFANNYSTYQSFGNAVNKGLKIVASVCKIELNLSSYYARFSFASIARNDLKISKDDIALSLNHVDLEHRTTEIYLKKDWSLIDKAIRKVIDYLNK